MKILPLFIPQMGCPFQCIYCNQNSITRSDKNIQADFELLIKKFCSNNSGSNTEIAFFGGTFTGLSAEKQLEYLHLVKPYLPEIKGIRISTRPDCIDENILLFLAQNGVTSVELGIQTFSDNVLSAARRGYSSQTAQNACQLVKKHGFDLYIQLMPGLPQDTLTSFKESIIITEKLSPCGVRLYPALVLKDTAMAVMYKKGLYKPLSLTDTISWLKWAYNYLQDNNINILKMGLHSDILPDDVLAGPFHPSLGEIIRIELLADELVKNWQPHKTLTIAFKHISLFTGHDRLLIKKLKKNLLLDRINVAINKDKKSPLYSFSESEADRIW